LEDFEARLQPKMAENSAVAAVRAATISAWPDAAMTEERRPETPARKVAAVSGSARRLVQALRALMLLQAPRAIAAPAGAASDVFQAWLPVLAAAGDPIATAGRTAAPIALQPGPDGRD
jgi:hypothetical protein